MRLNSLFDDPLLRWNIAELNFEVFSDADLQRIIDLSEIQIQHEKNPKSHRSLNRFEVTELNTILRKAEEAGANFAN